MAAARESSARYSPSSSRSASLEASCSRTSGRFGSAGSRGSQLPLEHPAAAAAGSVPCSLSVQLARLSSLLEAPAAIAEGAR
ncbi:hypothetical protein [Kitasatospora sp. NBC_00315]|uniref:hypothetical protein n=1 Tax=Kitasatospora sp. NBC_00315 TaxID=2975963 RepID=UPI00324F0773